MMEKVRLSEERIDFPEKIVKEVERKIIPQWRWTFPSESTYVMKRYSVPSLIVRVDGTLEQTFFGKKFRIYEVEERPTGIGWLVTLDEKAKEKFEAIRKWWPPIAVARDNQMPPDDNLWVGSEIFDYETALSMLKGRRWIVRAEPFEKKMRIFQDYAVTPVVEKGNKIYGEKMGWWIPAEEVNWEKVISKGFVLKPKRGSKGKEILIFPPEERKSYLEKIMKKIEGIDLKKYYLQKFYPPSKSEGKYFLFELFFAFSTKTDTWEFLGGLWVSRRDFLITHWVSGIEVGSLEIK